MVIRHAKKPHELLRYSYIVAFIFACILRITYINDIEYKADEREVFHAIEANLAGHEGWRSIGMNSSNGLRHAPLGFNIFILAGKVFQFSTPVQCSLFVVVLNLIGFVLLWFFIRNCIAKRWPQYESLWLLAGILFMVNPLAVALHRKIWAPSMLFPFVVLYIWAWCHRHRAWAGAFSWGVLGSVLTQIHLSGGYFAFGIFLYTALFGNKKSASAVSWKHWFLGSMLASITLLPWLKWVQANNASEPMILNPLRIFMFKFYNYWVSNSVGYGVHYVLGAEYADFKKYPYVFPLGGLVAFAIVLGLTWYICALIKVVYEWFKQRSGGVGRLLRSPDDHKFLLAASLVGFGGIATLSAINIERYFFLNCFPIPFLTLAWVIMSAGSYRRYIASYFIVVQLLSSVLMLSYVHAHRDRWLSYYGMPYSGQFKGGYIPSTAVLKGESLAR